MFPHIFLANSKIFKFFNFSKFSKLNLNKIVCTVKIQVYLNIYSLFQENLNFFKIFKLFKFHSISLSQL